MTTMGAQPPVSPTIPRPSSATIHRPQGSLASNKFNRSSQASDEDAKTSVKVAIRIRPPLKPSDPGFDLIPQRFQRITVQNTSPSSLAVESPQGKKLFIFDRVFGGDVTQEGVFEYINPGVDAFLQGYNVSIMAYGQSGAGKSFTMGTSSPSEDDERQLAGIVPRAAESLFAKLTGHAPAQRNGASSLKAPQRYAAPGAMNGKTPPADRDWQLKATYVEIYNEQLRDLLIPTDTAPDMRPVPTIREDKGRILLTNLTQIDISSTEDLMGALNYGSAIRQTDATAINARSSRSHAIFSLNLVQKRVRSPDSANGRRPHAPTDSLSENMIVTDSKLHFVDLAGSERLKNTGASGDRAKEGIAINAGLASLGKVISQLSSRNVGAHVSYRDSKLTRILQDSLGGNAITYLVACVTPAEFHLSETLNTVQYAQRARAIQSKPQIQHANDEGDKQALIDRLRAEIAFLRDQIKSAQNSAANGPTERSEEREADLQEQLLGVQESYSALSKRHAKLISEISKAGKEADQSDVLRASPAERIERANSMNKVIDQVVSEYEETIATLQTQMRSQKASLDSTENRAMEQESKISYIEKVNGQLQTRAQKFMDRESSLESYVRDLEARLDGRISSDDRNAEFVAELRKQINTMRDTEATSEDYIAGLEERLAEAEQDMELMNREINRLENVVERQRSVGRLDSLMMELNNIQKKGEAAAATELLAQATNGHISTGVATPVTDEDEVRDQADKDTPPEVQDDSSSEYSNDRHRPSLSVDATQPKDTTPVQSPTQMQFIEEKLDSVNQELVALRVEHESTVSEYDILAEKYQETLRALAALQRSVDIDASPESSELKKEREQRSTLSSGFSAANEDQQTGAADNEGNVRSTPATSISSAAVRPLSDISEAGAANKRASGQQIIAKEIDQLKAISVQKDGHIEALSNELEEMKTEHDKVLETIANLRNEVQRAKAGSPASPTNFVRRKSGHNALGADRTNRAFVSLSNIAADYLEDKPDARDNFQIQIAALSNEMSSRSERIENLEGEVANAKKEMEAKMQIISGLARERSSMIAASPVDVSVVATMRDQLVQHENHIKALNEQLETREKELQKEIRELKAAMTAADEAPKDGEVEGEGRKSLGEAATDIERNLEMERNEEMIRLREKIEDLSTSEQQLISTISELETTLSSVDQLRKEKTLEAESKKRAVHNLEELLTAERRKVAEELITQKTTIEAHASRYDALQQAYESLQKELNEHSGIREASIAQLESHRSKIDELELHLSSQYDAIEEYKETIDDMVKEHTREIEEMQAIIAQHDMDVLNVPEGEEGHVELRNRLAVSEAARTRAESTLEDIQAKVETLNTLERQLKQENDQLREREQRSSRLVEHLEGQLTQSYDDSQQSSNRLSAMRRTSQHEVAEARATALKAQQEVHELQVRLQQLERAATPSFSDMPERANSMASRKSIAMSLPSSPPPAMPLPPLPQHAPASPMVATFASSPDGRPKSPPTSVIITKRDSATQATIQEQEARIRTVEKHLNAEKQLTATLEEALTDLEATGERVKREAEEWRKKATEMEAQLKQLQTERVTRARESQLQLEREITRRKQADDAIQRLEQNLKDGKPKKSRGINCFQ